MPTFTAIALESLLEPSVRRKQETKKPPHDHIFISPTLYTTPELAPIPDPPASLSPSPYVVNRKRRVPEAISRLDGFQVAEEDRSNEEKNGQGMVEECVHDLRDSEDGARLRPCVLNLVTQNEFYDAAEEFLSDGSSSLASPSLSSNYEVELRAARMNLFEEIERRKKAEEALGLMHTQWQRIAKHLSCLGLSFPMNWDAGNMLIEIDSAEQFCQEVVIARFVSEAVGRGQARAEAEAAAEVVIGSKNHEINHLRDKLQYYEAVNHEMSQRNQEAIEIARRQRQRRNMSRRWLWSCIGFSITLGASVLAYSYLPRMDRNPLLASSDYSDVPLGKVESSKVHP